MMPLEHVKFDNPEDFRTKTNNLTPQVLYGNEQNNDIYSTMPLDVQMAMFPDQPYLNKFERPELNREPKPERPGFFSSAAHSFSENNEVFEGVRAASSLIEHANYLADPVEPGWTAYEESNLDGIDKRYWGYIFDAVSPRELQARREFILNKQDDDAKYNDGSILGSFVGGAAGILFSPTTALFPLSSTLKYSKASQAVIQNTLRLAPQVALQGVAHNAVMEGLKVGGNLEDFAVNSIRDVTTGLVLTGGAVAYGSIVSGGKLFAARKIMNLNREGIDIQWRVNNEGVIQGMEAQPLKGNSLSAAEVSDAQDFLDSRMAKEGLFKVPGISKVSGYLSPLVRMLNSQFSTVSEFANRLSDHSIITQGLAAGRAAKNSFERIMWGIHGQTKDIIWQLEGYRNEANGIVNGGSPEFFRKALSQRMQKEGYLNKEEFGSAVSLVIRTGVAHSNKSINAAANALSIHLETGYKRFLAAHGLSEEILSPRTAINYLMRHYNRDAVMSPTKDWSGIIAGELERQDNLINTILQPIRDYESLIEELESVILKPDEMNLTSAKSHSDLLANTKLELKRLNEELDAELRDNHDYHILLEERNMMSSSDIAELKKVLQPLEIVDKSLNYFKSKLIKLREQQSKSKSSSLKAKTEQTRTKHNESYDDLQIKIEDLEKHIEALEYERLEVSANLNGQAMEGKINSRLFLRDPETGFINFRNPNDRPKLRKVYEDNNERRIAADAARETILGVSPEQLGRGILSQITGGSLENPLKTRTLMIPDTVLHDGGFLSNDLSKMVSIYDSVLGKKTAFREVFGGFGSADGLQGVIDRVTNERRNKLLALKAVPGEAGDIAVKKMYKEFDKAINDISNAYNHAMGNYGTGFSQGYKARQFARGARAGILATRLGALPLAMLTDIGGVIFNNNFIRVIRDGILPCLETFNGHAKSKNGIAYRESAAHLSIATEHLNHAYTERMWNSSTMSDVNGAGKLVNGLEGLAHISGNLSGANFMDNWIQRLTANVTQSKVMRMMFKFKEGTLSDKEKLILHRFGIPPEEWAERFITSYEKHGGESNGHGGHYSYYYLWEDAHANVKMGEAIRSGVRESVLKKGILDAPFLFNDPAIGLITYLKGFSFTAFNRYSVPTMQRIDAEKAAGIGVLLLMGSLVDPLRKWTRGESYDFSDHKKFALDTINNSGALGIITDVLQDINALTDNLFLGKMKNDRYRERTLEGIAGGPLIGIANDVRNVLNSFASGKINQKDMQKAIRLIPLTQMWYLRYLSNKLVEGMNLPENRNQANGWTN